jgi:glycosyltransferase involved in cell wall biosynthesis
MGMPKVSVIIPCFNQGPYLGEAVESVLQQTFQDFEILVVDDGSNDPETVRMLEGYERPKTRVMHTDNQGLAAARNNGIREAKGQYILPLDADDKIGSDYLEDAVRILDRHPDIGIVYSEAAYFGVRTGHWHLPEYSTEQMLFQNLIFCSALFRREDWDRVGGYNINMVYGWEDWDFWLSLIHLDVKVYRIPRVHFFYRIREASMIQGMDEDKRFFMMLHALLNHRDLYRQMAEINILARVTELFFDTGFGFTPHQVIRKVAFGEKRTLDFHLDAAGPVRQVRFHPLNAPLAIYLDRMEATDSRGESHVLLPGQSNALWREENHWIFRENHPWIIVDLSGVVEPRTFSVHLQYLAVGAEVYPEILKVEQEAGIRMMEKKEKEINDLESEIRRKDEIIRAMTQSTSWRLTRPLRWLKGPRKP